MSAAIRLLATTSIAGLLGLAAGSTAFAAASNTAQAQAAAQSTTVVEDVVVTAQRRSENLQKVPIAITAVTGQALQQQGVIGFKDLGTRVPSLRFGAGASVTRVFPYEQDKRVCSAAPCPPGPVSHGESAST